MIKEINELITLFSKISGLGSKTAKKIIFTLLDQKPKLENLMNLLEKAQKSIFKCKICGNFDTSEICTICTSTKRDSHILCIVETAQDLFLIENMKIFNGKYFIIGTLFPEIDINNTEKIEKIKSICIKDEIKELIIALNITLEGKITAFHIKEQISPLGVKITSLATGVPVGGEISYLDEGTLKAAFIERK